MKEENKQESFFEKHKTEILIVGVAIIAVGTTLLVAKNGDKFNSFFNGKVKRCGGTGSMVCVHKTNTIVNNVDEVLPKEVNVREHLRKLPNGHFPSLEKKNEAAMKYFVLGEHQTLVSEHTRIYAA